MCKNIPLNDRQRIIDNFPITDRKSCYPTLDDAIKDALRFAFKDINFRTLREQSDCQKLIEKLRKNPEEIESQCKLCDEYKNIVEIFQEKYLEKDKKNPSLTITNYLIDRLEKEGFIKKFITYFNEDFRNEDKFDRWHNEACNIFLNILCLYYPDAKYGKAQKIVNMMFKHLYCMEIETLPKKLLDDEYFKYCHLTLDSFTLDWFHREVVDNWHDHLNKRGKEITLGKTDSWSNLQYCNISNARCDRINSYKKEE